MNRSLGLLLIVLGLGAVVVGAAVWAGGLAWFGRLPGDIRIETEHTRVYVPLASMILVSVVLTVVLNLLNRWM